MNNKADLNEKYVLLVEDNEDDIELTQLAFKQCGITNQMIVAQDGQEALDFLFGLGKYEGRDTTQLPGMILLDLKLPIVSGKEVLRQVRLNTEISRIPVVVLSSTTNMEEVKECEELGINRYYRKPGSFAQFQKIIQEIRESWLK